MRIKHLFLFGVIFLMAACQKEEIDQQQETNLIDNFESTEKITGEQAKDVINFLDQTISSENLKLGKLNLPFDKKLIDKKTIVKVEDSETGLINYTFAVKRNESDNFLFQVVVTELENKKYTEPYIFKYQFDDAFRKKLNKGEADWSEYKWPIYPYSLSAAEEALSKSEPCPPIDPSPSSGGTGSTSGGSTSGGSTGGGSTGGGYSSTPCIHYIDYVPTNVDWIDENDHSQGFWSADIIEVLVIDCSGAQIVPFTGSFTDCPNAPEAPIGMNDPDRLDEGLDDSENFGIIGATKFGVEQDKLLPNASRAFCIDQVHRMAEHLYEIKRDMAAIFYATVQGMLEASDEELYALYSAAHDSYSYIKRSRPKEIKDAVFDVLLESAQPVVQLYLFEIGGPAVLEAVGARLAQSAAWLKVANTLKLAATNLSISSSLSRFKYALKYGINSYDAHKAAFRNAGVNLNDLGVNVHHLIEVRLKNWGVEIGQRKSIVLTIKEHQAFTNAWRAKIPYDGTPGAITTTSTATKQQIIDAAREIYKNYPEILQALGL